MVKVVRGIKWDQGWLWSSLLEEQLDSQWNPERKKAGVGIGLWEEENEFKFGYAEFQEPMASQVGILSRQTDRWNKSSGEECSQEVEMWEQKCLGGSSNLESGWNYPKDSTEMGLEGSIKGRPDSEVAKVFEKEWEAEERMNRKACSVVSNTEELARGWRDHWTRQ